MQVLAIKASATREHLASRQICQAEYDELLRMLGTLETKVNANQTGLQDDLQQTKNDMETQRQEQRADTKKLEAALTASIASLDAGVKEGWNTLWGGLGAHRTTETRLRLLVR